MKKTPVQFAAVVLTLTGLLAETVYVEDITVTGIYDVVSDGVPDGEIEAGNDVDGDSGNNGDVVISSTGDSIFWARTKITLSDGFHAEEGSLFWAATDEDMDGFSDTEEGVDTDGDGMIDAWEATYPSAGNPTGNADGDSYTNYEEYLLGTDPTTTNGSGNLSLTTFPPLE